MTPEAILIREYIDAKVEHAVANTLDSHEHVHHDQDESPSSRARLEAATKALEWLAASPSIQLARFGL